MSDKFLGRWLVTEYVFNPNGTFAGQIEQKRELYQLSDGQIRVIQNCQPDEALASHPMDRFRGEWVFDLSVDGRLRRYHGPAVIGTGLPWRDGVMTGSGLWPDFGYSFRSYGILINPQRQLTGGQFYLPGEMVANIIGVAEPEDVAQGYPQLDLDHFQPSQSASGQSYRYEPDGQEVDTMAVTRQIVQRENGFEWESAESEPIKFQAQAERSTWCCQQGDSHGFGRQFGPALMIDLHDDSGNRQTIFSVSDKQTGTTVELWHFYKEEQLQTVEFISMNGS